MNPTERHRRLRLLVKKVNKERKKQAKKIDILCNDLVAAQRDFIRRLSVIGAAANFYKSILGTTDIVGLLNTAGIYIKQEIPTANVAFFLRSAGGSDAFELHVPECDKSPSGQRHCLESCFSAELVENICKLNRICTIDDMLALGLQDNPMELSRIAAATLPLEHLGRSLGFVLLYRGEIPFTHDELSCLSSVTAGLSKAIQSCRTLLRSGR
jgi:hypothetical protein